MSTTAEKPEVISGVSRLTKDLRIAAVTLSSDEASYLVGQYYSLQRNRIRAGNQIAAIKREEAKVEDAVEQPHETLGFFLSQFEVLEDSIKSALDKYSTGHANGSWARSITGIGPVLAAGLLAHIDVTKEIVDSATGLIRYPHTAGALWRFAGLDPNAKWGKGEKRPWNGALKVLCWKIGESFVKVQANTKDVYGKVYAERKAKEIAKNENFEFKDQAESILATRKISHDTDAYAAYILGKLPPAHIHSRAKRYAVKLFLAHYFEVCYFNAYGKRAPMPYVITHLNHAHYMEPPNAPWK